MTTVTLQSPTQQMIERSKNEVTVNDAIGRSYTLADPGVTAEYDHVLALGKAADNQTFLAMTMPLIYLKAIDGDPVIPPRTLAEVRALIQRIGRDGMKAISVGIEANFFDSVALETEKAQIKKS